MAKSLNLLILLFSVCGCMSSPLSEDSEVNIEAGLRWLRDHFPGIHTPNKERSLSKKICGHEADIVFVLDSSTSISESDYELQRNFVASVVDNFDVESGMVHIGVVIYASEPKVEINLGTHTGSENSLIRRIHGIPQIHGDTYTNEALVAMRNQMRQYGRPDVPQIAVVITDGESTNPYLTEDEAELTHRDGITVLAVGVGKAVRKELSTIASSSDKVLYVDSYNLLGSLHDELLEKACPPDPSIEGCKGQSPMDLLLAAPDEAGVSDSITVARFFSQVIDLLNIDRLGSQVGLTPRICSQFDQRTSYRLPAINLFRYDQKSTLQGAVVDRVLKSTHLSQQLEYLMEEGFPPHTSDRADAKRTVILIVDQPSANPQYTDQLASEAKRSLNVNIIVVGIGRDVDKGELRRVASSDAFFVDTYDQLSNLIQQIKDALCRGLSQ